MHTQKLYFRNCIKEMNINDNDTNTIVKQKFLKWYLKHHPNPNNTHTFQRNPVKDKGLSISKLKKKVYNIPKPTPPPPYPNPYRSSK